MINLPDFEYDIKGKLLSFNGDVALKPAKAVLPFTDDYVKEILKCKNDIVYFAQNYVYVLNLDQGMIKPKVRAYQKNMLKSYEANRMTICLSSRQSGKTMTFTIFILWSILFKQDYNVAILANVHSMSIEIMNNLKLTYSLLPKWLQQGVVVWNERRIKLENNCVVYAAATSKSAIRGRSVSLLILDETAFVTPKYWESFYNSIYPTISSSKTSKIIMVSTANGKNHFYKFWTDAHSKIEHNGFNPIRVDWWEVPGRDEKWKEETIRGFGGGAVGAKQFAQEFGNDFQGSSATLISQMTLNSLTHMVPIKHQYPFPDVSTTITKCITMYKPPMPDRIYSMSVDSAKVTEHHVGDAVSMQILDVSSFPFEQVCTVIIREGISYLELPEFIYQMANLYNEAMLFIENNEGAGQSTADKLASDSYDYQKLYWEKDGYPGYRTTTKTKRLGCSNLTALLDSGKLLLHDQVTIHQLSTFVKKKDSYKADGSYYDDAVMSLIGAIFFMQDREYELDNIGKLDYIKGLFESAVTEDEYDANTFGFMDDGMEEEEQEDWSWVLQK